MIKKTAAAVISAVLALCMLTGCGNEIQGHEASVKETDSNTSSQKITNDSIVPMYDSSAKKADNIDYLNADNMQFYFERLVVAGDSIGFGWQYYGLLPKERVVAQGGLSTMGFSVWEQYETTGMQTGMDKAMKFANPMLLYICLGMNDVNETNIDTFTEQYRDLLKKLHKICPNCLIVVQSITPVASTNEYPKITNSAIKSYNAKLKQMVTELGREDVIYFDAYSSLLNDEKQMDLKYDAGDGLHINTDAYKKLLEDLSKRLNRELAKQRLEAYEEMRKDESSSSSDSQ